MADARHDEHAPVDMPEPLEVDGAVVRPLVVADADALQQAVLASLDHLRPFLPWIAHEPGTVEQRRQFIAHGVPGEPGGQAPVLGLFEGGTLVGVCGLHHRIGPGGIELGYWVHAHHVGRGHGRRLVRVAVDVAFTHPGVDVVEIHHDVANVASERIPAALGFTLLDERLAVEPAAPAETGVRKVWRMMRAQWVGGPR